MKKFLGVTILSLACLAGCGRTESQIQQAETKPLEYEEVLLNVSETALEDWGILPNRTFEVNLKEDKYIVDLNGERYNVEFKDFEQHEKHKILEVSDLAEPDQRTEKISEKALAKILDFVEKSKIIKAQDKKKAKEALVAIDIKRATIEDENVALYKDGTIYLGKGFEPVISEWMVVHEYMHVLAEITNGGVENEPYAYDLFNEVMTDILVSVMEPELADGTESAYAQYHYDMALYIGCFGEKAISAYFYGYDEIYSLIGKETMDFYVQCFQGLNCIDLANPNQDMSRIFVNNCINCWGEQAA